jgi:ABC-type phosphate transport system substrate-binding protein
LRSLALFLSLCVGLCAAAVARADSSAAAGDFKVVVHESVPGSVLSRAALAAIFIGEAASWGDGNPIRPVDQSLRSATRLTFIQTVLRQSPARVQFHWQREISLGRRPPVAKLSDEAVLSYVATTPGAVGYVSAAADVPPGVKVVRVVLESD